MGSVVLDAVESFFGHSTNHQQRTYHESPAQHHSSSTSSRSRTPSRAEAAVTDSSHRSTGTATSTDSTRTHTMSSREHSTSTSASHSRSASRPANTTSTSRSSVADNADQHAAANLPSPAIAGPEPARPRKIKVRDLAHIQSFATEDMGSFSEIRSRSRSRSRGGGGAAGQDENPQYEISGMKVEDIIEMVAGLLTKITATNDRQHEHLHRPPPAIDAAAHLSPQTSSVLAFHGKNVPSITILSYLSRINKYCPTSYEVFLALLVYFDRMTERVNAGPMQSLREANRQAISRQNSSLQQSVSSSGESPSSSTESLEHAAAAADKMQGVTATAPQSTQLVTPPSSGSMERAAQQHNVPGTPHSRPNAEASPALSPELSASLGDPYHPLAHFFVVDSFNIHRLVIAGVTCASKFFSDIFYTNSRYAKVGGLPLPELNHLELQFLLLNDFRLSVPVEEIEAYGTMLVEFYAREVVAQQRAAQVEAEAMQMRSMSEGSESSVATVRAT